jgi:hypothetical protein
LALFLLAGIQKAIGLNPDVQTYWIPIITGILLIGSVLMPNLVTRYREARQINQKRGPARSSRDSSLTTAPGTKDEVKNA